VYYPVKFDADIFIQSRGIDIFPKINQDGGSRHLRFSGYVNLVIPANVLFRRVDTVVFVFCTKFGSYICYSHQNRQTYAIDIHLMTSRELNSGFYFWLRGHLCVAVMDLSIKFGADILIQSGGIDITLYEFGHSGMLIVWYLCSVPNLVQISVIVTEIDSLILQTFIS